MKTRSLFALRQPGLAGALCLLLGSATGPAMIVGPYQPDAATLHLWHMDSAAVPVTNHVSGGFALTVAANGATLGNPSYPGFGTAVSTLDGGQAGTNFSGAIDAYLAPATLVNGAGDNIAWSFADPVTGAFTFEAIIRVDFDPTLNMGPVANGGNGRNLPMQIISGEQDGTGGGVRSWQFRLLPVGFVSGASSTSEPRLEFINVNNGTSPRLYTANIPTAGPHAIISNGWYHVAVTYNGDANTADNLKMYWTVLDGAQTQANEIYSTSMDIDLFAGAVDFCIGNTGRTTPNNNFLGLIDEVRISKIARPANGMLFASPVPVIATGPVGLTVGVEQTVELSVSAAGALPLGYQWKLHGTNLPGATDAVLIIPTAQMTDAGPYTVTVTNAYGSVTSDPATVTVRTPVQLTWADSGSGQWNTTDFNWDTNSDGWADTTFTPGDAVRFTDAGSGSPTVSLVGALHPTAVTVDSGADYTLTTTGSGTLWNKLGLTKKGGGKLTVDTDNTFVGPTMIEAGVLQVGAGGSRGTLGFGPITNQSVLFFNRTGTLTITHPIVGGGDLINSNTGTIRLLGTNLLAASTDVIIERGLLTFGPAALGAVTNIVVRPFGVGLGTQLGLTDGAVVGSNVLISLSSTNEQIPGVVTNDWRSSIYAASGTNLCHAALHLNGNNAVFLSAEGGAHLEVTGPVDGANFTYQLALRGGGTGRFRSLVNLPQGALAKTDGSVWVVEGNGSESTYLYTLIVGGRLAIGNDNALRPAAFLRLGNGIFDLAGFNQTVSGLSNDASGARLIANSSTTGDSVLTLATSSSWVFDGLIADSVAGGTRKVGLTLNATGGSSLTLTATNTYSGDTTINAGTLALSGNGALPNTATIHVAAGATLSVAARTGGALVLGPAQRLTGDGAFNVFGGLTNQGTIELKLNKVGAVTTNDSIRNLSHLSYGGTLRLVLSGDPLTVSDSFKLFYAGGYSGAFATIEPATPGAGLEWDTSTLASDGTLRVKSGVVSPPVITASMQVGSDLVFSGTNGVAGAGYTVVTSTNVALSVANWTAVKTGVFCPGGTFAITNAVNPGEARRFFLLRVP